MDTSMIKHVSYILNLISQSQAFQVYFTVECSQVCNFAAGYLLLTAVSQFWADRSSGKKLPQRCSHI